MNKKITVIVPCYNVERYIERCLDSILNNTCKDFEIIAVNDCSSDNTLKILQRYQQRYKNIRVIDLPENLGLGGARDSGFLYVETDYVMFIDSDDFINPNTLDICTKLLSKYNPDLIEFSFEFVKDSSIKTLPEDYKIQTLIGFNDIWKASDNIACNKIFKTLTIRQNGLKFKYRLFEDTHFTTEYELKCKSALKIHVPLYYYYVNPKSLSHTLNKDYFYIMTERSIEIYNLLRTSGHLYEAEDYIKSSLRFMFNKLWEAPVNEKYSTLKNPSPIVRSYNALIEGRNSCILRFIISSLRIVDKKHVLKALLKEFVKHIRFKLSFV